MTTHTDQAPREPWKPKPRASYNPSEPWRSRDDTKVELPQVGTGPKKLRVDFDRPAPRVRGRKGDKVDVLLDDGRIVRGVVQYPRCYGCVWVEGIPGRVMLHRVRPPGGFSGDKGVTYEVG